MESGNCLQNLNYNIFPRSFEQKNPIKGYKHEGEKRELHRIFLVYFLSNSFVLPPHGRLNLFG